MEKFIFIRKFKSETQPNIKNKVVTNAEHLPDIIQEFETFLRGCGFYFSGALSIIEEEE